QPALHTMLTSLGRLYERGVAVNWPALHQGQVRRKIVVPTYPFQRQRYWVETKPQAAQATLRPLVDQITHVPLRGETLVTTHFSVESIPLLAEHRVYGEVVSPGAVQLAFVLSGYDLGKREAGSGKREAGLVLRDVMLPQALVLPEGQARTVQAIFSPGPEEDCTARSFQVISFAEAEGGDLATHATGVVAWLDASSNAKHIAALSPSPTTWERGPGGEGQPVASNDLSFLQNHCTLPLDLAQLEASLAAAELTLGPSFHWIAAAWRSEAGENAAVLAHLVRPATIASLEGYPLHPGLLDACFQATTLHGTGSAHTKLPFALDALHWHAPTTGDAWWCHSVQTGENRWDLQLFADDGQLIASVSGFQVRAAPASAITGSQVRNEWLHTLTWQPQPLPTEQAEGPGCWLLVGAPERLAAELAATAPVASLHLAEDLSQQVTTLAAQYGSLGVVFWGSGVRGQGSGVRGQGSGVRGQGLGGEGHPSIAEHPIAEHPI
ncbi:MAG: hypothetical protein EI684_20355, partial [Candidatus Viridilinea halotolerans]